MIRGGRPVAAAPPLFLHASRTRPGGVIAAMAAAACGVNTAAATTPSARTGSSQAYEGIKAPAR